MLYDFAQHLEQFTWTLYSPECLLIKSYTQGTLWKKLLIAAFVERFKTTILRKSYW